MNIYLYALIISIFSSFFNVVLNATQFVPLSIEKQVSEADFAVEATLLKKTIYKNTNGLIMSDYQFRVDESFGLNEKEFHLDIPGGTLEGITAVIEGAPQFTENEKIFLLLKKVESKVYLSNFTLGKYQIIKINGKIFYRSEVFPLDPRIGIISKEKMRSFITEKWHESAVVSVSNSLTNKIDKNFQIKKNRTTTGRIPAGIPELLPVKNNWFEKIITLVGILGFAWIFWILKKKKYI
jgi:hypothetical protein